MIIPAKGLGSGEESDGYRETSAHDLEGITREALKARQREGTLSLGAIVEVTEMEGATTEIIESIQMKEAVQKVATILRRDGKDLEPDIALLQSSITRAIGELVRKHGRVDTTPETIEN